ncbi:MAG: mechanosensitive ion channel [Candidatus Promineofilum sp.]|nr:mechanosensitive ion channel [Promineifilum sp.]
MQQDPQNVLADLLAYITTNLPEVALRLLGCALLLLVGRWLALRLSAFVARLLERNQADKTVVGFLSKSVYVVTLLLAFLVALSWLGIPTTSIITVLGASTLAIGLALQDSLSNLASGLLLIFLKPFIVGDYVQIGSDNNEGTVTHVHFFHTELNTGDNKVLLVPNSDVMSNQILNFTRHDHRRLDLVIGIGYDEDIRQAKAILTEIVTSDSRVLAEPAPRVAVNNLGESSIELMVRPFVRTANFDATRTDLLEQIKLRFDEAGITPNPQRAVRLVQATE